MIILLPVIRHASGPQESQEQTMAWPAPLHLTDPFILEAHWRPEMSEEDSAQCLLSPRPHMRVEGRGLASRLLLRQCRRLLMWALAEVWE